MKRYECPKCHTHMVIRLALGFVVLIHCTVCCKNFIVCKHCMGNMRDRKDKLALMCRRCGKSVSVVYNKQQACKEDDSGPMEVETWDERINGKDELI